MGLVYVRGAFYYHAWAEIYMDEGANRGHWLPVDPTFNQFPADATHVRLARGGLDKQAAIISLIGALKMTIVDVDVVAGRTAVLVGNGDAAGAASRFRSLDGSRDGACRAFWVVANDCDSRITQAIRRVHSGRRCRSGGEAERFTAFSDRTAPERRPRSG